MKGKITRREGKAMQRGVIYTRLSTDEQVRTSGSLETQEEGGRKLIEGRGDRVVRVFREEGYSGAVLERPALSELRAFVKGGGCDYVVAFDTDRLARKLAILGLLEYEFERVGVTIFYCNTPDDPLAKMIKGLVGEIERLQIRERSTRNKEAAVRGGKVMGNWQVPLGYDYILGQGRYEKNEAEAETVRRIFEWVAYEGCSLYAVAQRLNDLGVIGKRGARWWPGTVAGILRNETYYGEYHWRKFEKVAPANPRKEGPRKHEKSSNKLRPAEDHIVVQVPAIVSRELWDAAQAVRDGHKITSKRNTKLEYPLSRGILWCGLCGYQYHGWAPSQTAKGPNRRKYKCGGRTSSTVLGTGKERCKGPVFNASTLEADIWGRVTALLSNPAAVALLNMDSEETRQAEQRDHQTILDIGMAEADIANQLTNLGRQLIAGRIAEQQYDMLKLELDGKLDGLAALKEETSARIASRTQAHVSLPVLEALAAELAALPTDPPLEVQRRVLLTMGVKLVSTGTGGIMMLGLLTEDVLQVVMDYAQRSHAMRDVPGYMEDYDPEGVKAELAERYRQVYEVILDTHDRSIIDVSTLLLARRVRGGGAEHP